MSFRLTFVVALGVSGIVLACGTGSGGSSGGGAGTATDAQTFISQYCAVYAPCCGKLNKPTDGASCRSVFGALVGSQQYNSAKGNACIAELNALSSDPVFCQGSTTKAPSCKGAFVEGGGGTAQPGEDCTKDGDCAASSEGSVNCASSYNSGATTKSCQVEIEGKAGDTPCISTRDGNTTSYTTSYTAGSDAGPVRPAAKGFVCDVANGIFCSSKTKACTPIQAAGAPCEGYDSYACVKTAYCDASKKLCVARKAVGEACTDSQSCIAEANCDTVTKKCVQGLGDGAACKTGTECASKQCVNGKCDAASGASFSSQLLCGS